MEVKHAIKRAVPECQLTKFHFTRHEMNRLKWVKSHEFILNGHYYDVVKKVRTKNGFFFHCISDNQETELFAQLRTMTSFNLSQTGKNHPIQVWFKFLTEPMEKNTIFSSELLDHQMLKESKDFYYLNRLPKTISTSEDPPPQRWS